QLVDELLQETINRAFSISETEKGDPSYMDSSIASSSRDTLREVRQPERFGEERSSKRQRTSAIPSFWQLTAYDIKKACDNLQKDIGTEKGQFDVAVLDSVVQQRRKRIKVYEQSQRELQGLLQGGKTSEAAKKW